MLEVDEVLMKCLQKCQNKSKQEIKEELENLSNTALQQWIKKNCEKCTSHDKRNKKRNSEFIAKMVVSTNPLPGDQAVFSHLTSFLPNADLANLSATNPSVNARADKVLELRKTYGPEVFSWPEERKVHIRYMNTEWFNEPLKKGMLPPNLTHLTFGHNFNQVLEPGILPTKLTHLTFDDYKRRGFNQSLVVDVLPASLLELKFGSDFERPLTPGVLPVNLTHLTINALTPGVKLPRSLRHLTLNIYAAPNRPLLSDVLPPGLTHLELPYQFDYPLTNDDIKHLPNLTHLTFPKHNSYFNQSVTVLPPKLTHLTFGDNFNRPLGPGVLPTNLTHLTFGQDFNRPLDKLPDRLTHLTFHPFGDFCYPLEGILPPDLTELNLGRKFNHALKLPHKLTRVHYGLYFNQPLGELPDSLTHLTVDDRFAREYNGGSRFNQPLVGSLPRNLTQLKLGKHFNQPLTLHDSNITELQVGHAFDQPLVVVADTKGTTKGQRDEGVKGQRGSTLPRNLTKLIFGTDSVFNHPLEVGMLPKTLTHLKFGTSYNCPLNEGVLPETLIHLTFGSSYNQPLGPDVLPQSITELRFGYAFNQPLVNSLPKKLTQLAFTYNSVFNQSLEDVLPDSLTQLTFQKGCLFNQPLLQDTLPKGLLLLDLSSYYNVPLEPGVLPKSLTHLKFQYYNQPLEPNVLPMSLTHLIFLNESYAHPISQSMLPEYLTHMIIPPDFNLDITDWSEKMKIMKHADERPIKVELAKGIVKIESNVNVQDGYHKILRKFPLDDISAMRNKEYVDSGR